MDLSDLFPHVLDYSPEALSLVPTTGGVYLFTDSEDRLIQLATSADLKRALQHRLSVPAVETTGIPAAQTADAASEEAPSATDSAKTAAPSRRINLREIVSRIWWKPAHSQFELTYEYYRLARVLMPQGYRKQLAFGPAWFVHVDPAAHTPQVITGKFLRSPPGVDLGPFATQSDATRFIEILQETFDLCRYHHILEQAPHGQACAYFEMGKCPAPCDGTIPLAQYRGTIDSALGFARGQREPTYNALERAMREAAAEHQFERAGAIKKQLDRSRGIEHAAFARVRPIQDFNYLILQRGAGTTRLRPFFVCQGAIVPGQEARRKDLPQAIESWFQQMRIPAERLGQQPVDPLAPLVRESLLASTPAGIPSGEERSEHIWLVSHFLFKPDAPGLCLHGSELHDPARVLHLVHERFKKPARAETEPPTQTREETDLL